MRPTSWYLESWTVERLGLTVECSRAVLAGIERDVTARPLEVGGVLFGVKTENGVRILAYRTVSCEYASGPSYKFSERDEGNFQRVLALAADDVILRDMAPVGWYHSHIREGLSLSDEDVALYNRYFPEAWQVAFLLRPEHLQPTRAAFFFREPESTTPAALACEEFTMARRSPSAEGTEQNEQAMMLSPLPQEGARGGRKAQIWIWLAAFALLLAPLLISRKATVAPDAHGIGLRVSDLDGQLLIRWNWESPQVLEAGSGYLDIADGVNRVRIDVDRLQLQRGSIAYSRTSGSPLIRMVLERPGAAPVEESVHFVGPPAPAAVGTMALPPARPESPALPPEPVSQPAIVIKTRPQPAVRTFRPLIAAAAPAGIPPQPVLDAPPAIAPRLSGGQIPLPGLEPGLAPAPAPVPVQRPSAPALGRIIWTGRLERRGVVEIDGQQASAGHISGALPGRPVHISVFPGELSSHGLRLFTTNARLADHVEDAGPQNGWNPTEYVCDPDLAGEISLLETPAEQNGWKRLALRSEKRSYTIIVLRWDAAQR